MLKGLPLKVFVRKFDAKVLMGHDNRQEVALSREVSSPNSQAFAESGMLTQHGLEACMYLRTPKRVKYHCLARTKLHTMIF